MRTKKETVKSVAAEFTAWRKIAKDYITQLREPLTRRILSVDVTDAQGKLNGVTVVELVAIVNLLATTGEKLYLVPYQKSIVGYAVKDTAPMPTELL
jgi:hypothetical protein